MARAMCWFSSRNRGAVFALDLVVAQVVVLLRDSSAVAIREVWCLKMLVFNFVVPELVLSFQIKVTLHES